MQNFTDIPSSRTLSDSLIEILNNDKTAISCNSGTTFPTTNQQVGMLCYRTDQLKLYQLIGINPDNWRFIMDLASGIDAQFAAKLNAAAYTAADVLAKLLTVDGAGSGLDADLLDGQHASSFASASHNHNAAYLGISAKATDADRLDGYDASAFVRSVNGGGPDANGNATVNIDLSGRVARSGDSMSGRLTLPSQTVQSTSPTIDFYDTDQGSTRYLHVNSNLMGFLKTDGNWDMYMNNGGSMWTANQHPEKNAILSFELLACNAYRQYLRQALNIEQADELKLVGRCFGNVQITGGRTFPHYHQSVDHVLIHYLDIPDHNDPELGKSYRHGTHALLLQDPRGAVNYPYWEKVLSIAPYTGKTIIHPAYVWHESNPYRGQGTRMCLVVNFQIASHSYIELHQELRF